MEPPRHPIGQWYFKPRSWETRNNGAIYAHLGVRVYKKYLPTSGDLVTRARGIKRLRLEELVRRKALEDHIEQTCIWERRHLNSVVLLQSWAIFGGIKFGVENFWISTIINMIVNIYPIMLQRYNRARIVVCIQNMQSRQSSRRTRAVVQS